MIWEIEEKEQALWYTSDVCRLKITQEDNTANIWVNYKGFNIAMPMEMWGFGAEVIERGIAYRLEGGRIEDWNFVVPIKDLRLFVDLIYFFLKEHDSDGMIQPKLNIKAWN